MKSCKVGITACSDARPFSEEQGTERVLEVLREAGLDPVRSDCIFSGEAPFGISPRRRGEALNRFYEDHSIRAIFDLSGGNLSNDILGELDYEVIASNPKPFWGYSDLTALMNAVYARTGGRSFLYNVRNLTGADGDRQTAAFKAAVSGADRRLFQVEWEAIQGHEMEGILIGGNLRCFLKLAGTPYFPSFRDKILFLETLGGSAAAVVSMVNQLRQMGAFEEISGLLLGTFTEAEAALGVTALRELIRKAVGSSSLPMAKTQMVGHGEDSRCLVIGERYGCQF